MQATGQSGRTPQTHVGTPAAVLTCAAVDSPAQAPARSRLRMTGMVAAGGRWLVAGVFGTEVCAVVEIDA